MRAIKDRSHQFSIMFSDEEFKFLERLCKTQGVTKAVVFRRSMALYRLIVDRAEKGEKLYFKNNEKLCEVVFT